MQWCSPEINSLYTDIEKNVLIYRIQRAFVKSHMRIYATVYRFIVIINQGNVLPTYLHTHGKSMHIAMCNKAKIFSSRVLCKQGCSGVTSAVGEGQSGHKSLFASVGLTGGWLYHAALSIIITLFWPGKKLQLVHSCWESWRWPWMSLHGRSVCT